MSLLVFTGTCTITLGNTLTLGSTEYGGNGTNQGTHTCTHLQEVLQVIRSVNKSSNPLQLLWLSMLDGSFILWLNLLVVDSIHP